MALTRRWMNSRPTPSSTKVVRNELRLAFLAPEILDAILNGKPGCSLPIFEGSQQSAGVRSDPNYMEITAPPNLNIKVPWRALICFSGAHLADRRLNNRLLVRRPSRQLADSEPVKRRTSADGIKPS